MDEKFPDDKKPATPYRPTCDEKVDDWYDNWVTGMKDDMEDAVEEQGVHIRQ